MKAEDCWTIPLTRMEHCAVHLVGSKMELQWFLDRGINPTKLATELWEASGDLEQMTKIVRKHYEHISEHSPRKEDPS